jgi:hypothetical protein
MNDRQDAADVREERVSQAERIAAYISMLKPKAQRAMAKRLDKAYRRDFARRAPAEPQGYRCPKCWGVWPTPEARLACRQSHKEE